MRTDPIEKNKKTALATTLFLFFSLPSTATTGERRMGGSNYAYLSFSHRKGEAAEAGKLKAVVAKEKKEQIYGSAVVKREEEEKRCFFVAFGKERERCNIRRRRNGGGKKEKKYFEGCCRMVFCASGKDAKVMGTTTAVVATGFLGGPNVFFWKIVFFCATFVP